jgi:hypothetical protein
MSVIYVAIRSQIKKCLKILIKILSTNFYKNPSNWNQAVACGQTDRQSEGQRDRSRVGETYGQQDRWNLESPNEIVSSFLQMPL